MIDAVAFTRPVMMFRWQPASLRPKDSSPTPGTWSATRRAGPISPSSASCAVTRAARRLTGAISSGETPLTHHTLVMRVGKERSLWQRQDGVSNSHGGRSEEW